MGIVRGVELDMIEPLTEHIISSGLKTVEITMNTANASECIRRMVRVSKERLMIGAGTVLTLDELNSAFEAGATFIVMPTLERSLVEACAKKNIPVFPGALTPTEIHKAWISGATMVKVFPAKVFGSSYFKEIKGPFHNVKLLACGGVNPDNIKTFFSDGADAVAFGSSVFKKEWLATKKFKKIEESVKDLIAAYRK